MLAGSRPRHGDPTQRRAASGRTARASPGRIRTTSGSGSTTSTSRSPRRRRASTRSCSTTSASRPTATSRRRSSTEQAQGAEGRHDRPVRRSTPATGSSRSACASRPRSSGSRRPRDGHRPAARGSSAQYLDAIYPMVYPSHFGPGEYHSPIRTPSPASPSRFALHDFRREASRPDGDARSLAPGLLPRARPTASADVQAQIDAARRAKPAGYLLWNADGRLH